MGLSKVILRNRGIIQSLNNLSLLKYSLISFLQKLFQ